MKVSLRRTKLIVTVLFGLAALFYLPLFKKDPLAATLDNSWVAVITWAAEKPLQFGRDIIFTYGPLGHLMYAIYLPRLFVPEIADRLERLLLERNSDDFVFDNQILAQVLWLDCTIGEVTCPARYLPEASSINFRRSIRYGFGCILTALEYRWAKIRGGGRLFPQLSVR